jgi:hypothetical protein
MGSPHNLTIIPPDTQHPIKGINQSSTSTAEEIALAPRTQRIKHNTKLHYGLISLRGFLAPVLAAVAPTFCFPGTTTAHEHC